MSLQKSNHTGHIELISVALIVYPDAHDIAMELLSNVQEQDYPYKEIILLNNTSNLTKAADLDIEAARMVSIYDTEEDLTVGTCLNLASHNSLGPCFIYWNSVKPKDLLSKMKQALDDYKADVVFATDQFGAVDLRSCLIRKHRELYYKPTEFPFREFLDRAKVNHNLLYLPMKNNKTL